MATPTASFGTLLARETTPSSGTYTDVGGVTDLNLPSIDTEFSDGTQMSSPGGFRVQVPTLSMLGDVSFTLHYDSADATQEQMTADAIARTVRNYRITGTDTGAAVWVFAAYVASFNVGLSLDGLCAANVTLKPTGQVTRS